MKFDSLVLTAILKEIKKNALRKRVENIYQPSPLTIVLTMVLSSDILISVEPNMERVQLTDRKFQNPPIPPSFCMQLRKYLRGGFLIDVEQIEWERIAKFRFSQGAELIVEIMGKHSNIILVEGGEIKGAIKLVDEKMSPKRQILPKLPYQLPPTLTRKNPLLISEEEMSEDLKRGKGEIKKFLQTTYQGMSPFLVNELLHIANISPDSALPLSDKETKELLFAWLNLREKILKEDFQPVLLKRDGEILGFWAFPSTQGYEMEEKRYMSEAVDEFYYKKDRETRFFSLKESLKEELENAMEKWKKAKENCEKAIEEWGDVERFYQMGSLILANLRLIKKGAESVTLENFFDEERRKITIPLSKELNPQQNADRYFQLYRKGKKAIEELRERIKEIEKQLEVLQARYEELLKCQSLEELEALKEGKELSRREKKVKPILPSVRSSDGFLIQYGKNARQNEILLKSSSPEDVWLHAKGVKGAHVVIKREGKKEIPFRTIKEAAQLAAYLSSARGAGVVPVDWTLRKYVRKPKRKEKGFVIYTREKTIMVQPAPIQEEKELEEQP